MSKVSIITTTYNHEHFITQTIKSILSQTHSDWELLIGDDSPNDATWSIIQNYISQYPYNIKARHHSPNKGIVENTNFLLSQVSKETEYVAFLEGDDLYTNDNLKKKIEIFKKYPEVALVYSDMSFIDKDDTVILGSFFRQRNIPWYQNIKISLEDYILAPAGPICSRSTGMIKKEILLQYHINNILPEKKSYGVSDRDMYFQIATNHKVYGIYEPLTQYRRHANNLSAGDTGTSHDLIVLLKYYLQNGWIAKEIYDKKVARCFLVACVFSLEQGKKCDAYNYLKQSFDAHLGAFLLYKIICCVFLIIPKTLTIMILKKLMKRG